MLLFLEWILSLIINLLAAIVDVVATLAVYIITQMYAFVIDFFQNKIEMSK